MDPKGVKDSTNNAAELNDALAAAREAADAAADAAEGAVDVHDGLDSSQNAQALHAQPQSAERPANTATPEQIANATNSASTQATAPVDPTAQAAAPVNPTAQTTVPADSTTSAQAPYDPSATKAKKSKTVKIIIAIVIVLLLIVGGGMIWLFAYYNQPNQLALDSITKLLNAEHVTMQGSVTTATTYKGNAYVYYPQGGESDSTATTYDDDEASTSTTTINGNYNKSGTQQITVSYTSDDFEDAGLNALSLTVQRGDGQAFVNVSGADDLLSTYLYSSYSDDAYCEDCEEGIVDEEYDDAEYDDEDDDYEPTYILNEEDTSIDLSIDDTWWQLNPTTIVEYFGLDEELGEAATCLLSDNTITTLTNDLATAYATHPFITAVDYTGSELESVQRLIEISFDETNLANFILDYYNSALVPVVGQCVGSDLEEISADDAKEYAEDIVGNQEDPMVLAVDFWSHELVGYYYSISDDGDSYETTTTAEASFSYPASLNISEPSEYEDVTSMLDELGADNDTLNSITNSQFNLSL